MGIYASANIVDADVSGAADIAHTKTQHLRSFDYSQTGNVAAATVYARAVRKAGTIVAVEAVLTETIPSGDRTVTIDVKKGNPATAYTTVLSAPVVLDNGNALRTAEAGTLSVTTLAAGDSLQITVAVAGSTGTQPQGLLVSITYMEKAQ